VNGEREEGSASNLNNDDPALVEQTGIIFGYGVV